jgi:hypothetical protein
MGGNAEVRIVVDIATRRNLRLAVLDRQPMTGAYYAKALLSNETTPLGGNATI